MLSLSRGVSLILFPAILLALPGPGMATAADTCGRVLGNWSWFSGGTVAFADQGKVLWTPTVKTIPPATGTWTCAAETGTYKITWQNGFVDTLNLSGDRTRLAGVSSTGVQVSGSRLHGATAGNTAGAKTAPAASTEQTTQDGWTPFGNSGFGKQSTVPIGPKGPQRIGPQGRPPPKGAG